MYAHVRSVVDLSLAELRQSYPEELRGIEFAEDQGGLASLLQKVGETVNAFFRDLPNTSAREQVRQERLRNDGKVDDAVQQSFNYVAEVHAGENGVSIEEFRTDNRGRPLQRNRMKGYSTLTSGFAVTGLLFHPRYQVISRFRYLGRQSSEPNAAHLIAFAQMPETGISIGSFRMEGMPLSAIYFQGLAWVDPDSYQIVRLRADLLAPRADIGLTRQTSEIWFSEVRFNSVSHSFWLPREVVVTAESLGVKFRNRHRYSNYIVFVVESLDKLELPRIKKIP